MIPSVGIIGGADGPTAIYVSRPVGQTVLLYFVILLFILALANYMARRRNMHRFFAVMGAAWVVIIDQWVKMLTVGSLSLGETAELLPGLFRLERVHNYGAAWSSFSGARWLLVAVTAAGLCALAYLVTHVVRHPLGVWALWLVIGGGIGNLIDRLRLGYVVDMIATEFIHFPVFNVADIFVTCGAFAAAIYYLKFYEKYDAKKAGDGTTDGTDPSDNGT